MILTPASSTDPAAWIADRVGRFGGDTLGSIMPSGFASYGRVFHPAWKISERVTWRRVSAVAGTTFHPGVQWPHVAFSTPSSDTRDAETPPSGAAWDTAPDRGSLDRGTAEGMVKVLRRHTASEHHCWAAFWEGWGIPVELGPAIAGPDLAGSAAVPYRTDAPVATVVGRNLSLFEGPIDAILGGWHLDQCDSEYQSPTCWWPADHSWYVMTDIDLDSTYVGGSSACIDSLIQDPFLEVVRVDVLDGISWASDTVNTRRDADPLPG